MEFFHTEQVEWLTKKDKCSNSSLSNLLNYEKEEKTLNRQW